MAFSAGGSLIYASCLPLPVLLSVYLDIPDGLRPRMAYALETLLDGCGITPLYTQEQPVLSIGVAPAPAPVQIQVSETALAFFSQKQAYNPRHAFTHDVAGVRLPVLFGTPTQPDWLCSAFYWLSGWQEWTTTRVDQHGRFCYEDSLQHALGTAHIPVVDLYATALAQALRQAGVVVPGRKWAENAWAFCPTHDIDALRKWQGKAWWRAGRDLVGAGRALTHGDPYARALRHLQAETRRHGVGATYYFKGGGHAREDHHYRLGHPALQSLLREPLYEIGLHPSYHAYNHAAALKAEQEALCQAAGRRISAVRNHYLRYDALSLRLHEAAGFETDSTLSFARHEGWRRGTCRPFRVYDIEQDRATNVWEMPLAVMDTTLFGYRNLDAAAGWRATEMLLEAARRLGGVCVGLWHNGLENDQADAKSAQHFTRTLDAAVEGGALVTSVGAALRAWQKGGASEARIP